MDASDDPLVTSCDSQQVHSLVPDVFAVRAYREASGEICEDIFLGGRDDFGREMTDRSLCSSCGAARHRQEYRFEFALPPTLAATHPLEIDLIGRLHGCA